MIGHEIAAALPELRKQAESLFTDTCRITQPGEVDETHFNHETGEYDEPVGEVIYEGKCRIPSTRGNSTTTTATAGEQSFGVGEYPFEIPASAEGVGPGQTVTYLSSAHNPTLVGRVFGIVDPLLQSHPTRLRFKIKTGVSEGGS